MLLTYAVIHVFNPLIRVESCRRPPTQEFSKCKVYS